MTTKTRIYFSSWTATSGVHGIEEQYSAPAYAYYDDVNSIGESIAYAIARKSGMSVVDYRLGYVDQPRAHYTVWLGRKDGQAVKVHYSHELIGFWEGE